MITVIILARNEARNLEELLPQLKWADRVLVIDDGSTDGTRAVCQRFMVERIGHALDVDYAEARNFALAQVKTGWVLFIDADERMDQQLVDSVHGAVKSQRKGGYSIRRVDVFYGKRLKHGETGKVWLTRLAWVKAGVWRGKVHETWDIGTTQTLAGELLHYSHPSTTQLFTVVKTYARLRAHELFEQKRYWSLWEQLVYPPGKFVYTYIITFGFLDGWQGLMMSLAMAWHSWLVRWYLWDLPMLKRSWQEILERYLLIMPWILLPLGQLTRSQEFGRVSVYSFELFMGLGMIWSLVNQPKLKEYFLWWPTFLFSFVLGLSYIISLITKIGSPLAGLYWLRWLLYAGYILVVWQNRKRWYVSVSGLIRYVGYGLVVGGILQFLMMPDMRWLYWFGWDNHYFRMIGTLFDPNFFGLMVLLITWWAYHQETKRMKWIAVAVGGACVMATFSRTAYGLAAGLVLIEVIRTKRWLFLGLCGVAALLMYVVLPKPGGEGVNLLRTYSITSRWQSVTTAWNLSVKHPFFGIGYDQYPWILTQNNAYELPYHPAAPDNSWLLILVTSGWVGLGTFGYMLKSWFKWFTYPWQRISLGVILIHSLVNNSFFYPWVLLWIGLLFLEQPQKLNERN